MELSYQHVWSSYFLSFQPLSPPSPVIVQWAYEQSGHGNRDRGNAWVGSVTLSFTHQANLATVTAKWPVCQQQRSALSSKNGTIPGVINQLPSGWLITLGHFQQDGAVLLCSYWNKHSAHRFAFPAYSTSVKTTVRGPTESLIHHHVILQSFAVIKKLTSQQMKCGNGQNGVHMGNHTSFKAKYSQRRSWWWRIVYCSLTNNSRVNSKRIWEEGNYSNSGQRNRVTYIVKNRVWENMNDPRALLIEWRGRKQEWKVGYI